MNPDTNIPDNVDWDGLKAGLDEVRRRPNKLSAMLANGPKKAVRHQMRLTPMEHAAVKLISFAI